ncbi:MAG TPA: acyl-CoA thioesterase [Bacillus bacterium]|uniref:acyl-CoA thioesterase n=1 Tax=Siminovitchia fordii TaxID=254759 RepID=UPI0003712FC3|nr:thioesterase family protein [Siminovitchia fordii]HBZ09355.1 acyl-CoA thioesterase [Bacillus sp. (in: firmicutes)]
MSRISYIENLEEWKNEFSYYQEVKVRFSETDMFGHLNNTVPLVYFEQARIGFFKKTGLMQKWLDSSQETIPVVADLQCDFLSQVYFDELLKIFVKVNKMGTSSIDLHYMGVREDESLCFTGRGMIVQVSKSSGKSVPWSDEFKERLLSKI